MRWLARQLLRFSSVRRAVLEQLEPEPFRPDRRFRWGVILLLVGLVTGWPLVALLGGMALWSGSAALVLVGGPLSYAISWVIYGAGLMLAGLAARSILTSWTLWLLRRLVERLASGNEEAHVLANALAEPSRAT